MAVILLSACAADPEPQEDPPPPIAAPKPTPRSTSETRTMPMRAGTITGLRPDGFLLNGKPVVCAGKSILAKLEVGDDVYVTFYNGRAIEVERLHKGPVQAPRTAPEPPAVGETVEIDQVRGIVRGIEGKETKVVVLDLLDEGRIIGRNRLPLRPSTIIRRLQQSPNAPAPKEAPTPTLPQDTPIAAALPKTGPFASPTVVVDSPREKNLTVVPLAAVEVGNRITLSVRVENNSPRTLAGYELTLDFDLGRRIYSYGELRVARRGEEIPPGGRRVMNLTGETITPGAVRGLRITLAAVELR